MKKNLFTFALFSGILVTSQTKLNVSLIAPNYYATVKELYKKAIETQLEKLFCCNKDDKKKRVNPLFLLIITHYKV